VLCRGHPGCDKRLRCIIGRGHSLLIIDFSGQGQCLPGKSNSFDRIGIDVRAKKLIVNLDLVFTKSRLKCISRLSVGLENTHVTINKAKTVSWVFLIGCLGPTLKLRFSYLKSNSTCRLYNYSVLFSTNGTLLKINQPSVMKRLFTFISLFLFFLIAYAQSPSEKIR